MSIWAEYDLTAKIVDVLGRVTYDHHFGHPYVSAHQLAIELQRLYPDVVAAIGEPLGGVDTRQRSSLSQYLARELSGKIKADPDFPIEGGFLWSGHIADMSFTTTDGTHIRSSLPGSGFPLSMFRLRE